MDFFNNSDLIDGNNPSLPKYDTYPAISGLQYSFTDETNYVEPYALDEFKDHAYIDANTDDNLIGIYLKAARIDVENHLQKSLGIRTITLLAQRLPKNYRLPWGPVQSITTAGFTLFGDIVKEGGEDVTLEYTTNASLVNDSIKQAIYKQAFSYYENRDKYSRPKFASGLIDEVKMILNPYRRVVFP